MTPHDTSPGDDQPSVGERIDDLGDVATGRSGGRWYRGRFRNKGAQPCSVVTAMAFLTLAAVTLAFVALL
jgi:hypothetical protein